LPRDDVEDTPPTLSDGAAGVGFEPTIEVAPDAGFQDLVLVLETSYGVLGSNFSLGNRERNFGLHGASAPRSSTRRT